MFGHQDDQDDKPAEPAVHDQPHDSQPTETVNQVVHPGNDDHEQAPAEEPATVADESASAPAVDNSAGPQDTDTFDVGATDKPDDQPWQHPGTPMNDDDSDDKPAEGDEPLKDEAPEPISDVIYPAGLPKAPTFSAPGAVPLPTTSTDDDAGDASVHRLIDIKVKALDELAPLIDDLDMPSEDKFRTVMMMIQASDNQDLVEKAYEIAHSIEDEKARAQALLDVVNEINYFTQPRQDQPEA